MQQVQQQQYYTENTANLSFEELLHMDEFEHLDPNCKKPFPQALPQVQIGTLDIDIIQLKQLQLQHQMKNEKVCSAYNKKYNDLLMKQKMEKQEQLEMCTQKNIFQAQQLLKKDEKQILEQQKHQLQYHNVNNNTNLELHLKENNVYYDYYELNTGDIDVQPTHNNNTSKGNLDLQHQQFNLEKDIKYEFKENTGYDLCNQNIHFQGDLEDHEQDEEIFQKQHLQQQQQLQERNSSTTASDPPVNEKYEYISSQDCMNQLLDQDSKGQKLQKISKKIQKQKSKTRVKQQNQVLNQNNNNTSSSKKSPNTYIKNICRYLTRKTIRCFASNEYKSQVKMLCKSNNRLYVGTIEYFIHNIENISGFKAVKEYLDLERENDPQIKQYKSIFKEFYIWFLKNRIVRYIMNGDMDHKDVYIKYKNQVMLKYVENLQFWNQQEPEKFKNEILEQQQQQEQIKNDISFEGRNVFKIIRNH